MGCIGCIVSAGVLLIVSGFGQLTAWAAEARRRRAYQLVLEAGNPPSHHGSPASVAPSAFEES